MQMKWNVFIFEIAIKNIVLRKVTKGGVSDANNKLIINIIPTVGSHRPQQLPNTVNILVPPWNSFKFSRAFSSWLHICVAILIVDTI